MKSLTLRKTIDRTHPLMKIGNYMKLHKISTKTFIHMWHASRKIKLLCDQGKVTPIF